MTRTDEHAAIGVTVLGSTGSIGVNTLDVIRRHPRRYRVVALAARRDTARLYQQCIEFKPLCAAVSDPDKAAELSERLLQTGLDIEVLAGADGLERVARHPESDCVMAAIVGAAGLLPTLAAAQAGKRVLLANKEALVMAGQLFMQAVADGRAELLPIDSEHNAIFQCLPRGAQGSLAQTGVEHIWLTASGGPFRDLPLGALSDVTPAQACAHPNWVMGRKISVDSATMMNKGLEVIEACWLFDCRPEQVRVLLHPQSVVHSMVAFADGSVLAQLGNPDMRTPIAHALGWPQRISSGAKALNPVEIACLEFRALEPERYPCLALAFEALRVGGTATTVLNAANEIAVQCFLDEQIGFMDIPRVIERTLEQVAPVQADSLETILAADAQARAVAGERIAAISAAG
jgi:1-deoxy-D-xylulose-5-phosphate reductoisomerase